MPKTLFNLIAKLPPNNSITHTTSTDTPIQNYPKSLPCTTYLPPVPVLIKTSGLRQNEYRYHPFLLIKDYPLVYFILHLPALQRPPESTVGQPSLCYMQPGCKHHALPTTYHDPPSTQTNLQTYQNYIREHRLVSLAYIFFNLHIKTFSSTSWNVFKKFLHNFSRILKKQSKLY